MVAVAGCDGRCCLPLLLEIRRADLIPDPAAAYRRQQQPYGLQDILDPSLHRTSSPTPDSPSFPKSLLLSLFFVFLYCYILELCRQHFCYSSSETYGGNALCLPMLPAQANVPKDQRRRVVEVWLKCKRVML